MDAPSSLNDLSRPKEIQKLSQWLLCSIDCRKVFVFPKLVVSQSVRWRTSCSQRKRIKWRFFSIDLCAHSWSWTFKKSPSRLCYRYPKTTMICLCWFGHHSWSWRFQHSLDHHHQTLLPQESQLCRYI